MAAKKKTSHIAPKTIDEIRKLRTPVKPEPITGKQIIDILRQHIPSIPENTVSLTLTADATFGNPFHLQIIIRPEHASPESK